MAARSITDNVDAPLSKRSETSKDASDADDGSDMSSDEELVLPPATISNPSKVIRCYQDRQGVGFGARQWNTSSMPQDNSVPGGEEVDEAAEVEGDFEICGIRVEQGHSAPRLQEHPQAFSRHGTDNTDGMLQTKHWRPCPILSKNNNHTRLQHNRYGRMAAPP